MFEREALAADVALKYPLVGQCEVPEEQVLQSISLDEPAGPHVVEGLPRGDGQVLEVSLWIDHLQPGHLLLEELRGQGQTEALLSAHVGVCEDLLLDGLLLLEGEHGGHSALPPHPVLAGPGEPLQVGLGEAVKVEQMETMTNDEFFNVFSAFLDEGLDNF